MIHSRNPSPARYASHGGKDIPIGSGRTETGPSGPRCVPSESQISPTFVLYPSNLFLCLPEREREEGGAGAERHQSVYRYLPERERGD